MDEVLLNEVSRLDLGDRTSAVPRRARSALVSVIGNGRTGLGVEGPHLAVRTAAGGAPRSR